jgi:hypothetical protein
MTLTTSQQLSSMLPQLFSHAERPVIDSTAVRRTRDATPQNDGSLNDGWNSKDHECGGTTSQPTQTCFGSWSAAFDQSEFAMPPPRILVGRELRSRPRAKYVLVVTPLPGDTSQKTVDAVTKPCQCPSYPSTRAWHNRCVGSSLLESGGSDRDAWASTSRSAEFDAYLLGL